MTDAPDEMLNIREVCHFFGGNDRPLDQSTIYRWVRTGKLAPAIRMGTLTMRWRRSDCQKALDAMAAQGDSGKGYA